MLLYLRDMNIIHGNLRAIYGHLCLKKGTHPEAMRAKQRILCVLCALCVQKKKTLGLAAYQGRSDLQNSV